MSREKNETLKGRKKVFIVDDHPLLRRGISDLINQDSDFEVCGEADDIPRALQAIADCSPDMAIVDISLGKGNGIRLIEELKHKYPELSVLTLSMHEESIYAERCIKAGAKGYIMKQEPSVKVLSALRVISKGEMYLSDNVRNKLLNKMFSTGIDDNKSPVECLSNRELEVFEMMGNGMKTYEIAKQLFLSPKTVDTYILHIKKKMGLKNINEVITRAAQWVMQNKL
jgi:DNA-binding NarL/FixJ family response regulator